MTEISWTRESEIWLKDIYDYIATDDSEAAAPIPRLAVHLRDGNHKDSRFQDLIDDAVGKSSRLAAKAVLSVRMPSVRKLSDSVESRNNFEQKLITKTWIRCCSI